MNAQSLTTEPVFRRAKLLLGGSRRGYLRLRIVSAVLLAATVVLVALPGTFPLWMKLDQCACGLLLLPVVIMVNARSLRGSFTVSRAG